MTNEDEQLIQTKLMQGVRLACPHCGEDLWVFIEPDGNVEAIAPRDMPNDDDGEETDDLEHWGQPDFDPRRRLGGTLWRNLVEEPCGGTLWRNLPMATAYSLGYRPQENYS